MDAKITKNIEKAKRLKTVEEEFGIGRNVDPYYEINALRALNTDLELRLMKKKEESVEPFINGFIDLVDVLWDEYKTSKVPHEISLIYTKLNTILEKCGCSIIDSEDIPYDDYIHRWVDIEGDADSTGEYIVTSIISPGFMYKRNVIRKAEVKITNKKF